MIAIKQAVSVALLYFVWQGLVVAFVLWMVLFALRNRPANARYLASCVALLSLAALPVITSCVLYQGTGVSIAGNAAVGEMPRMIGASLGGASSPVPKWLASLEFWALPLWSFGVVVFSLRLVWGCRQVALLRRRGVEADGTVLALVAGLKARMGFTASVRVLISRAADGPSVIGWLRPVILLPAATVLSLTPGQLEAVLAHECAHIRRYDYLVNLLQSLVETVLFYHPAVWWVSARIRHERELCCDDLAVRSCGDVLCYARALASLEKLRVTAPRLALGVADGSLLYRIRRLAGEKNRENRQSALLAVLALCVGLACFALTMNWARGQAQDLAAPTMPGERGVSVNLSGAAVLHRTAVFYPRAAIEKRIEGLVVVGATLDGGGDVSDARVLSGPVELRKAALESVLKWHFDSGVDQRTQQISIAFQLPPEGSGPTSADLTRDFLRQEYEKATRNADALRLKLQIAEAQGQAPKATHIDMDANQFHNAVHAHLVRFLEWLRQ